MFSVHSYLRKGAIDNYDTIFCVGPHHINEIRETEKIYGLKPKTLVKYGFGRLDTLLSKKQDFQIINSDTNRLIIIAPSYGENNLLEKCGIKLIEILLKSNFQVMLRPHFRTLKDSKKLIDLIKVKFQNNSNFILEEGIIPYEAFYNSKCMISDWSGISFEYAFTFERQVIFIDVPKKELNLDSNDISFEPIEISARNKIGHVISLQNLDDIPSIINDLEKNNRNFLKQIKETRSEIVYNIGESANIGAQYIEQLNNNEGGKK